MGRNYVRLEDGLWHSIESVNGPYIKVDCSEVEENKIHQRRWRGFRAGKPDLALCKNCSGANSKGDITDNEKDSKKVKAIQSE